MSNYKTEFTGQHEETFHTDFNSDDDVFEKILDSIKTPYIGENGNWYEWDVKTQTFIDTGVKSVGENGKDGKDGKDYVLTDADKREIADMASTEYETIIEGELTEGGITVFATRIPVDPTEYKKFQFFAEVKLPALSASTNVGIRLIIADQNQLSYNYPLMYNSVTHKDGATYFWLVTSEIFDVNDKKVFIRSLFNTSKYTGNNTSGNQQGMFADALKERLARTDGLAPYLKLVVTNTTFNAGTKFYLKGLR